jgi:hypothetical protein
MTSYHFHPTYIGFKSQKNIQYYQSFDLAGEYHSASTAWKSFHQHKPKITQPYLFGCYVTYAVEPGRPRINDVCMNCHCNVLFVLWIPTTDDSDKRRKFEKWFCIYEPLANIDANDSVEYFNDVKQYNKTYVGCGRRFLLSLFKAFNFHSNIVVVHGTQTSDDNDCIARCERVVHKVENCAIEIDSVDRLVDVIQTQL